MTGTMSKKDIENALARAVAVLNTFLPLQTARYVPGPAKSAFEPVRTADGKQE